MHEENPEKKPFIGNSEIHKQTEEHLEWKEELGRMLIEHNEDLSFTLESAESVKNHIEFLETEILDWEHEHPDDKDHLVKLNTELERSKAQLKEYEEWATKIKEYITEIQLSLVKNSIEIDELKDIQEKYKVMLIHKRPHQEN